MDDQPGILSDVLKVIAQSGANILTIHQSIPVNGVASLSISIQVLSTDSDIYDILGKLENQRGIHHVKMIAKE